MAGQGYFVTNAGVKEMCSISLVDCNFKQFATAKEGEGGSGLNIAKRGVNTIDFGPVERRRKASIVFRAKGINIVSSYIGNQVAKLVNVDDRSGNGSLTDKGIR